MDSLEIINSKTKAAYNLAAKKYYDLFKDELNEKIYDRQLLDSFANRFTRESLICDAGCGPIGHIARYIFDKGVQVIGVDISEKCVEMAERNNPQIRFVCGDIGDLDFEDGAFDGIISYYSIIDTPKIHVPKIFKEFHRVLKKKGYLLVAVKAGQAEGYNSELLGIKTEIFFTLFSKDDIARYYKHAGFQLEMIEERSPYDSEITIDRIFAIGKKM